jgi:serine phosphatase RsbU (regulator of sigma subunit)
MHRDAHEKPQRMGRTARQQRLAARIAEMMRRPSLRDPALLWEVLPAHRFGGDAVAARRTPSGNLVALLADATGHGPAAAGTLLPVLQAFYEAPKERVQAGAIAREMNDRLRRRARIDRFVAAAVVEVEAAGRRVAVWNGGMPGGLWVHGGQAVAADALRSQHLPLGLLAEDVFDAGCSILDSGGHGHLVFFSDGLVEARDAAGLPFGAPRLLARVASATPAQGVHGTVEAVREHLDGRAAEDDISILAIGLGSRRAPGVPPADGAGEPLPASGWSHRRG